MVNDQNTTGYVTTCNIDISEYCLENNFGNLCKEVAYELSYVKVKSTVVVC